MVAVEQICKKCGEIFLRGIFPQQICEQCELREKPKIWNAK